MGSNITTTGSLNEVTVDGITDTNLISKDIIVSLSGDKFKNIAKDTDVTSWFKNMPLGLNAKVKEEVSLNATSLTVTLSGFPTQAQKSSVWIEIPKEVLQSTTYDVTIINKTTKFEIVSGTPVDIPSAITGLVYNGEEQKGIPENRAYTIEKGTVKNAGTYEARLILNKGYKWSDGTVDLKEVSWTISRLPIEVELTLKKDIFEYTGYEIKPEYEIVKKGSSLNINFSE